MAAQSFTNFSGNPGTNQPTAYVAADGFVGALSTPINLNSPTFTAASFPAGVAAGQTLHGVSQQSTLALAVTAVTNTDLTATLPTGARIVSMTVYTTTAFTAVTDAQISIGSAAAGAQYVAAVSIKAVGVYALTLVSAAAASFASFPSGSPNLFVRIAQSGGSTAVGAGTLVVTYVLP